MKLWIPAIALALGIASGSEPDSPDEEARFLAGLPVTQPGLLSLAADGAWQRHRRDFDDSWKKLEEGQLARIREWTPLTLSNDATSRDPLFYLFSGPDFLYANAFFPNARTYVLCGLEPVGAVPDVRSLPSGALPASLGNLRKSLNAVLSFSFFLTKELKVDLGATRLSGTLPVLYVFVARTGNTLKHAELVSLTNEGEISPGKGATSGVKIVFARGSGPDQTLYYFSTDLSNHGIKNRPGFIRFCERQGGGNGLIKAASYLMHMNEFSSARDFLLASGKTLVQDDSGIPYRFFPHDQWDVLFLGRYPGPIKLFENRFQADLSRAFQAANSPPLTFSFGYRWRPSESSVIIATSIKSVPKALPAAD